MGPGTVEPHPKRAPGASNRRHGPAAVWVFFASPRRMDDERLRKQMRRAGSNRVAGPFLPRNGTMAYGLTTRLWMRTSSIRPDQKVPGARLAVVPNTKSRRAPAIRINKRSITATIQETPQVAKAYHSRKEMLVAHPCRIVAEARSANGSAGPNTFVDRGNMPKARPSGVRYLPVSTEMFPGWDCQTARCRVGLS